MEVDFRLNWVLQSDQLQNIDPVLFSLLKAIKRGGSLKFAANQVDMSYRHAWGLLKKWQQILRLPLVKLERGRGKGARLTEFGEKMLWADQYLEEQTAANLQTVRAELNSALSAYLQTAPKPHVKMHASHNMAMTHLFDLLDKDPSINLELQIHGSLDSFRDLTSGHCQIAGLRIPFSPRSKEQLAQQYSKLASSNQVTLLKVASREQGILVKSGNPKNIISLEDLTRGSVRFINRQLNSGTRTTFDQLLARENIKAHQINDYESVEYGHKAVAAMIDSDVVDAGFGVEVSTETLKLNFVPILREVFVLVLADSLDEETRGRIGEHLGSLEFQQRINALAGYNAQGSGTLTDFDQLVAESKG